MENAINTPYRTLFASIFIGLMTIISFLLIWEYRYFRNQAEKMMELKEEYKNYLFAVKKIVDEYNKMKEEESSEVEKKKDESELKDSFMVVNREPNYLKQSMIDFMKEHGHETVLKRINFDEWRDYHDELLEKASPGNSSAIRARKRRVAAPKRKFKIPDQKLFKVDINFIWPIERDKFWLSSFFGPRKNPNGTWGFHYGIDMASMKGTPVKAAYAGEVIEAGYQKGFGKTIVVYHNHKYKTRYAHLSKILVRVGKQVHQGEIIGKVGDTGIVRSKAGHDPSHLHFEIYVFNKRKNPMYFFM